MAIEVNGIELPELTATNPSTGEPYKIGDTVIGSDGKTYQSNGITWVPKIAEPQPLPIQTTPGTDTKPNILFESQPQYQGSMLTQEEKEKTWTEALNFMATIRGKKDQSEYNRYVQALKNSPFWSGGKKVSRAAVDAAWKSALYSAAANTVTIQSLLFDKDVQSVVAGNESATGKYNNINYYTNAIKRNAVQQGVELDDAQIKNLASQAMSNSWDMATLQENIARTGKLDFAKGNTAATISALKQWAAENGITFDENWYQTATKNIITGVSTLETEKQTINSYAKGLYSAEPWAKGLDSGFSIRQQASPYINYLAKIRGVDPKTISLDDPILKKNLTKRDDKGNPIIPSYYDFTIDVRQNDPQWAYSQEAQDETVSMLNSFGKMFGKSW